MQDDCFFLVGDADQLTFAQNAMSDFTSRMTTAAKLYDPDKPVMDDRFWQLAGVHDQIVN